MEKTEHRAYVILSLLGVSIPLIALIWLIFGQTGGLFEYALDDPYIHLAMSEQIAAGGYGVNAGEYASAASSILFPFLLAPFAGFDWHWLTPLFWCIGAALAAAYIWGKVLGDVAQTAPPFARIYLLAGAFLGPILLHLPGLVPAGMEHNLHVLAAMMVAYGLIRYAETGQIGWLLVLGVLLNPLLRFEGLIVSCTACGVLLLTGRHRFAIGLGALTLAPVLIYFAVMLSLGLAPLPNSIMAKAAVAGGDIHFAVEEASTQMGSFQRMVSKNLDAYPATALLLMAFLCPLLGFLARDVLGRTGVLIGLSVTGVTLAHFLGGSMGNFFRYEIYAWAFGVVLTLYLTSKLWTRHPLAARLAPLALLAGLVVGGQQFALQGLVIYPNASAAIHVQQGQMARFIDDYHQGNVAVNDLGHVSFRNPHYVLDLWGLASRDALEARLRNDRDPNWADAFIARSDVGVLMIYENWFRGRINPDWIKVAEFETTRDRGSLGGTIVTFFAVSPEDEAGLRANLEAFAPTVPEGTELRILN